MNQRRISVALCTYNGEKFLQEQLDSIAEQTRLPCELVICDDASIDSTPDIVAEFARSVDFRVRFFRNARNLGSTKNFEQAITRCEGELIALCDQDDLWLPQKLAHQADLMERDPTLGGVFSDAQLVDETSRRIGKKLWASISFTHREQKRFNDGESAAVLLRGNVVTGPTLMFRADLRPVFLPIPGSWYEDAWIAWMLALHSKLAPIQTPLVDYRIHADQQIGVERFGQCARLSFRERFDKARREEPQKYLRESRELEELKRRLTEAEESENHVMTGIQEKIVFLTKRASPCQNRFTRAFSILLNAADYHRYEVGWRPLLRDVAILFL